MKDFGSRERGEGIMSKTVPSVAHARTLAEEGHLKAFSIGGKGSFEDKDNPSHLTSAEIYEISLVPVPADPEKLKPCPFCGGNARIKKVGEDRWLAFVLTGLKPKTKIYSVISKCDGAILGKIEWYPAWRRYCLSPTIHIKTVHSDRCLFSIAKFIEKLNREHKELLKKGEG